MDYNEQAYPMMKYSAMKCGGLLYQLIFAFMFVDDSEQAYPMVKYSTLKYSLNVVSVHFRFHVHELQRTGLHDDEIQHPEVSLTVFSVHLRLHVRGLPTLYLRRLRVPGVGGCHGLADGCLLPHLHPHRYDLQNQQRAGRGKLTGGKQS